MILGQGVGKRRLRLVRVPRRAVARWVLAFQAQLVHLPHLLADLSTGGLCLQDTVALASEQLKAGQDGAEGSLGWWDVFLPIAGGRMAFKTPCDPNHSVILNQ